MTHTIYADNAYTLWHTHGTVHKYFTSGLFYTTLAYRIIWCIYDESDCTFKMDKVFFLITNDWDMKVFKGGYWDCQQTK